MIKIFMYICFFFVIVPLVFAAPKIQLDDNSRLTMLENNYNVLWNNYYSMKQRNIDLLNRIDELEKKLTKLENLHTLNSNTHETFPSVRDTINATQIQKLLPKNSDLSDTTPVNAKSILSAESYIAVDLKPVRNFKKAALDEVGEPPNRTLNELNTAVHSLEYNMETMMELVANISTHHVGCIQEHVPDTLHSLSQLAPVEFIWTIKEFSQKSGRLMESEYYQPERFPYNVKLYALESKGKLMISVQFFCCAVNVEKTLGSLTVYVSILPHPYIGGMPITHVRYTNITTDNSITEGFSNFVDASVLRQERYTRNNELRIEVSILAE